MFYFARGGSEVVSTVKPWWVKPCLKLLDVVFRVYQWSVDIYVILRYSALRAAM